MSDYQNTIMWPIITSLIASLIFYFAVPWVRKLGVWVVLNFSKLSKKYSDSLYGSLPRTSLQEPTLMLLVMTLFAMLIASFILVVAFEIKDKVEDVNLSVLEKTISDKREDVHRLIKRNDRLFQEGLDSVVLQNPTAFLDRQIKGLKELETSYDLELDRIDELRQRKLSIEYFRYLAIFIFLFVLLAGLQYAHYDFIVGETSKYELKMKIIRPDINDSEYFTLCKKWALIQNKHDFDEVLNEIEKHIVKTEIRQ